ncbi:hypothetical protein H4217_004734 [Coemansia sp. RSA 1939]|nr:hypothetical protein H4217_004734 [Coemansia sp. RSA 1939]KAJ2685791.1 hypothetical protein GGH99_003659 [Coemansia sp. RSA 1285]
MSITSLVPTKVRPDRVKWLAWFTVGFGIGLMAINTLLFAYAVWKHKYPPIKAKNIPLIAVLYVSMLIWFIGTIGTNFNLPGLFDFKNSCIVFASWFRVLLGVFLFIHIHIFRLYTYLRIFEQLKRMTVRVYAIGALIYLVVALGYGIPITILRNSLTVRFVPSLGICVYGMAFIEISFSIIWAGWLAILVVTVLARNINTSFNEYKEMVLIITLSSITLLYETIVHNIVQEYILYRWLRTLSTFMEYLTNQTSLFILLGVPVYNCIFNHEAYKKRFFEKMRADGMVARYNLTLENRTADTNVESTVAPSALERADASEDNSRKSTQSGSDTNSSSRRRNPDGLSLPTTTSLSSSSSLSTAEANI